VVLRTKYTKRRLNDSTARGQAGGEPGRAADGGTKSWQPIPLQDVTFNGLSQSWVLTSSCTLSAVDPGKTVWWQ
jgi:hypothetical protein